MVPLPEIRSIDNDAVWSQNYESVFGLSFKDGIKQSWDLFWVSDMDLKSLADDR